MQKVFLLRFGAQMLAPNDLHIKQISKMLRFVCNTFSSLITECDLQADISKVIDSIESENQRTLDMDASQLTDKAK